MPVRKIALLHIKLNTRPFSTRATVLIGIKRFNFVHEKNKNKNKFPSVSEGRGSTLAMCCQKVT